MKPTRRAPLHLYHMRKHRAGPHARFQHFWREVTAHTPFVRAMLALVVLWLLFSTMMWLVERNAAGNHLASLGAALYWGIAAFSTAGIADTPVTGSGRLIGGIWIVLGSMLFFGGIVATITTYFMRPMQRPHRMIIDTIEYNLEQLDDLSVEEIELLRETLDTLIGHVERIKARQ